jgi:hypothetical protein
LGISGSEHCQRDHGQYVEKVVPKNGPGRRFVQCAEIVVPHRWDKTSWNVVLAIKADAMGFEGAELCVVPGTLVEIPGQMEQIQVRAKLKLAIAPGVKTMRNKTLLENREVVALTVEAYEVGMVFDHVHEDMQQRFFLVEVP